MDKKLACMLFTSYNIRNQKSKNCTFQYLDNKIAADLKQISSAHLKITKNCKVEWQYLKSLQNCTLSLNFHADILNCGDIAERGLIQRIYCGRLWRSKLWNLIKLLNKIDLYQRGEFTLQCAYVFFHYFFICQVQRYNAGCENK